MTAFDSGYRGRFAPSPTGPLHLGSLLTAVASFLDAKAAGGEWLVRIEDIDPPREVAGASQQILGSLKNHGLHWDGEVLYQSSRISAYQAALGELSTSGAVFDCNCTRATLGPRGSCGGRCTPQAGEPCAKRLRVSDAPCEFTDRLQGHVRNKETPLDIVVWRKDDLPSYQLAVTVDDTWQRINAVVRGVDLLSQTALQTHLIRRLGGAIPTYAHLPIICADDGRKLSKQNGAAAIDEKGAIDNLRLTLRVLRQSSAEHPAATPAQLLEAAASSWNPEALRGLGRRLLENGECHAGLRGSGTMTT